MSEKSSDPVETSAEENAAHDRRVFLRSLGKWSGAAIVAAVGAGFLAGAPKAEAGGWINRRGGGGGGWVNRGGGGGGWVNRGGGGWVNRYGGGGGGWVNRHGGGGGAWVNRW